MKPEGSLLSTLHGDLEKRSAGLSDPLHVQTQRKSKINATENPQGCDRIQTIRANVFLSNLRKVELFCQSLNSSELLFTFSLSSLSAFRAPRLQQWRRCGKKLLQSELLCAF